MVVWVKEYLNVLTKKNIRSVAKKEYRDKAFSWI